jgi:hypothetical protein
MQIFWVTCSFQFEVYIIRNTNIWLYSEDSHIVIFLTESTQTYNIKFERLLHSDVKYSPW